MKPDMTLRQPDSEFVDWLHRFDPELRVRWNPQRQRWVIDEKNRQTRHWQCILTWEDDDRNYLPINRDLALRLQLMRYKYNQLIVSPRDYLREFERKADFIREQRERSAADDRVHRIVDDWSIWKKALEA